MPRACTTCTHPKRAKIDAALVDGAPNLRVATAHGLAERSVRRHKASHIPETLARAAGAAEAARADGLLEQVRALQARALAILDKAEAAEDLRTALGAIREARGNLELLGKLEGAIRDGLTVNVYNSPEWLEVQAVILDTLGPFREARVAVAEALEELESGTRE